MPDGCGSVITVATVYHEGPRVPSFSKCYTPEWVDKLYRGVQRNYSKPFRFVCLVDKDGYKFEENIETERLWTTEWSKACTQLYGIVADRLVLFGLDTIITGNLDDIFSYSGDLAVPRDPYNPMQPCNGVVLCPSRPDIAVLGGIDMRVLDNFKKDWLDDLFPRRIKSYKVHVLTHGLEDASIVYFHGEPKPHVLQDAWVAENWK